jgi:hypothetical protein
MFTHLWILTIPISKQEAQGVNTAVLKVETDIITNISASLIGRAGIFVIMSVEAFKTDVIAFIGGVITCFTSD